MRHQSYYCELLDGKRGACGGIYTKSSSLEEAAKDWIGSLDDRDGNIVKVRHRGMVVIYKTEDNNSSMSSAIRSLTPNDFSLEELD